MLRIGPYIVILGMAAAIAAGVPAGAQVKLREPSVKSRRIVRTVDASDLLPFALAASSGSAQDVAFLPPALMAPNDSHATSKEWAQIKKDAEENGFDLGQKGWSYEQIVSPAFSEHVLLLFWRGADPDERSEFSAIVSRNPKEPLHIIPILRRGYFPYSTPQTNPMAMAAFNQALASEHTRQKPYWLTVSACYAALNGARAVLPSAQTDHAGDGPAIWMATPTLRAEDDGRAVARFAVEDAPGRLTEWELIFDKQGNVVNAMASRVKAPTLKVVRVEAPKRVRAVQ